MCARVADEACADAVLVWRVDHVAPNGNSLKKLRLILRSRSGAVAVCIPRALRCSLNQWFVRAGRGHVTPGAGMGQMDWRGVAMRWHRLLISVGVLTASLLLAPLIPRDYRSFFVFLAVVGTVQANWQLYLHRRLFGTVSPALKRLHVLYAVVSFAAPLLGKVNASTEESPLLVLAFAVMASNV